MTLIDDRPWIHQDVLNLMIQDYVKFGGDFEVHFKKHAPRIPLDFTKCNNAGAYIAAIAEQCFIGKFIPVASRNKKLVPIVGKEIFECDYYFPDGKLLMAQVDEEYKCLRIKTNC